MDDRELANLNGKLTDHVSLGVLTRVVPRYLVDEVISETGSREKRSRSLPAHVVVYFVLALALFHDGYEEVLRKLVNGLRFARVWSANWSVPTTGAITQARLTDQGLYHILDARRQAARIATLPRTISAVPLRVIY